MMNQFYELAAFSFWVLQGVFELASAARGDRAWLSDRDL